MDRSTEGRLERGHFHLYLFGYIVVAVIHLLHHRLDPYYEITLGSAYILMFVAAVVLHLWRRSRFEDDSRHLQLYLIGYLVIGSIHLLHNRIERYETVLGITYAIMFVVASGLTIGLR